MKTFFPANTSSPASYSRIAMLVAMRFNSFGIVETPTRIADFYVFRATCST